ncbi:MAG: hypothetical protein KUG65_11020 [Sphingomonadaceae bacterium]|nr:hypothetical protein [Sphingomonadaceae bacterium]
MANNPLSGSNLPFKIPAGIDVTQTLDAQFWRLHAIWRLMEDEFEMDPRFPDEDDIARAMCDRASDARDAMFASPIRTATALMVKLEACREGGAGSVMEMRLRSGVSVFDVIQWDCERLVKREMFGPDAFDDLANG